MKIDHSGSPIVVIPRYVPYIVAEKFARANVSWLKKHMSQSQLRYIDSGARIGQRHTVRFERNCTKLGSTVKSDIIHVRVPLGLTLNDPKVQAEARKASIRALKKEANEVLPSMIHALAQQYGYKYSAVRVKTMRSRWGSCSSNGDIALSIWLMQVPDELKRYVLCHELAHLNHPHHKSSFWSAVEVMVPNYKTVRDGLKQFNPDLNLT